MSGREREKDEKKGQKEAAGMDEARRNSFLCEAIKLA
jgi:hypothetical protein